MKEKPKKKKFRGLRILAKILAGFLIFILLIILFIRSPWGQDIIINKITKSYSDKTNTQIEVERLFITFSGNIFLDGVFLEDQKGDTLLYSEKLEADIPIWPIIRGRGISVNSLEWSGVSANISREDSLEGFNYEFLEKAFAPADTTTTAQDTSASQEFDLGRVNFKDFKLSFIDKVGEIDAQLNLGELDLEMEETNLETMEFRIADASIIHTEINYLQTKAFPESDSEEESPLPILSANSISFKNVKANYESQTDSIALKVDIADFYTEIPNADISKNEYTINELDLKNSKIALNLDVAESPSNNTSATSEETEAFSWPEFTIALQNINLENNVFTYSENNRDPEEGIFDPGAFQLENLNFIASDFSFEENRTGINLETLTFSEISGLDLREFSGVIQVTDTNINISELNLQLNNNHLEGDFTAEYASLDEFIKNQEDAQLTLDLPVARVDLADIFRFQPDLRNNEYLRTLSSRIINARLQASGTLSSLSIPSAYVAWGNTRINANGEIYNAMDPDNLGFNLASVSVISNRDDLKQFVQEDSLGIKIPQRVDLKGSLNGTATVFKGKGILKSSEGDIAFQGNFSNKDLMDFDAEITTQSLNLGNILINPSLGNIDMELTTSGSGADVNSLDAVLDANIDSLRFNNYKITNLPVKGEISNGKGSVTSEYRDDNLEMNLEALVQLDSVAPEFDLDLDVQGADLYALGITSKNIKTGFELKGQFKGNATEYDVEAQLTEGIAVYGDEPYFSGDLTMDAHVRPDTTALHINNRILELTLESNADPLRFLEALEGHYLSYLGNPQPDSTDNPVNIKFRGEIRQAPILNEVFISGIEEMEAIMLNMDFREKERELTADINFPRLQYNSYVIDSLAFTLDSDREKFDFVFGFNTLEGGPLLIKKTYLDGKVVDRKLFLDFISSDGEDQLVHVMSEISRENDFPQIHINPSELILNKKSWEISPGNLVVFKDDNVEFTDFQLNYNEQEISIDNTSGETEKEHIALNFDNFRLSDVLAYFNPETELAGGRLNGELVLEEPYGSTATLANLQIIDFRVMEAPFGELNLVGNARGGGVYDFELSTAGGDVDMDITGGYRASNVAAELDLDLQLHNMKVSVLEQFSQGEIKDGSGGISGNMKIGGTTLEPEYSGSFNFEDAGFNVSMLDAKFNLRQETIELDNDGIYFSDFTVRDDENNTFIVNGDILTETYLNPSFDLSLEAKNFTGINSTREDNDLFYGKANFDASARITGDLELPRVDARLKVNSGTDITYIMPDSELEMMERDGVVRFVNREDPDDILTRNREEESAVVSGMILNSLIEIEEDATFNLIIDEETGDNFRVAGRGDLTFSISPNGRTNLSGRYVMESGHYEMNLYGIVNRKFELVDGSSISWSGDPMDASLDISAIYRVETAASSLMSQSAAGSGDIDKFRQELPFLVFLNVDGELMQPVLSFGLDMPEDEQGAIGGEVYGRVQQLNSQEEELNKQVFSLLVLNRFFPEGGSDGSSGGTAAIARDNLNQALSDQLNRFSEQLLGESGIQLNFGVDSFTDYQGENPQDRTQLDITAQKRLMDDRLIVSVGSQVDVQGSNPTGETNPMIGNVSLEYLLTENGRFRLKGFRRNQYENIIDGQIIVNGIALIFTREFNKFKELFEKAVNEETEEEE